jgi:hypothetical protein
MTWQGYLLVGRLKERFILPTSVLSGCRSFAGWQEQDVSDIGLYCGNIGELSCAIAEGCSGRIFLSVLLVLPALADESAVEKLSG